MANRGRRGGGAAALFASRMTDEVEPTAEELEELGGVPELPEDDADTDDADDADDTDEADEQPSIDYSHIEATEEDDEEEPEPEPAPDALADLRAQIETLKAEREAEKVARVADDEAAELRQHQTHIATGLRHAKNALTQAKAELAKAGAAGDWNAVAEAQAKIAAATADQRDFEAAADEVQTAVEAFNAGKRRKPAAEVTTPAPANADPFEKSIAAMSDKSKEWCRTNKADLTKSQARSQKALAAHLEAVESGLKPDTTDYFKFLDNAMGYQTVAKKPKTPKPTGRAMTAAPAGGSGGRPGGNGAGDVKLSRDEVAMAKAMNMTVKAYAARKQEIIRNGQNPTNGGPVYSHLSPGARR